MSVVHKKELSVLELKRLLFDLHDQRPDIYIRFRLMGEMWMQECSKVASVMNNGVLLASGNANKFIFIPSLKNVMQFELECNFQNYEAFFHYDVIVLDEH
jgi:hypothetical protein